MILSTNASWESFDQESQNLWQPVTNSAAFVEEATQEQLPRDWIVFANLRYHYRLSYPPTASPGSVDQKVPASQSDVIFIPIDPQSDPIYICAADNNNGWSSEEFFIHWKDNPPRSGSAQFQCADYPSYSRWRESPITISGLPALEVVSFRGRYESVCSYVAVKKVMLAACLPAENPKGQKWEGHLHVYREIVSSIRMSG